MDTESIRNKKVSIIIPVYMVEPFLKKSIDSVLSQTYQNIEVLLIDDGSKDNCPAICDDYAKKDRRVIAIHQHNVGLSGARNTGLEKANGDYLFFLDSDDYIKKDTIETMVFAIEKSHADMCIANFEYVDEKGNVIIQKSPMKDEVLSKEDFFNKFKEDFCHYYVVAWNKLYTRKAIGDVLFPKGKIHEDEFTAHLFVDNCDTIVTIKEKLVFYTQRNGSITKAPFGLKNLDGAEAFLLRAVFFDKKDLTELANVWFCNGVSLFKSNKRKLGKSERIEEIHYLCLETYRQLKKHLYFKSRLLWHCSWLFHFLSHIKKMISPSKK